MPNTDPDTDMNPPAGYRGLDEAKREMRLVLISPGSGDDEVSISLETVSLLDEDLHFEALSYVWGSPEQPNTLHLQHLGQEHCFSIPITRNLMEALPYLRLPDRERRIFIDAISINQQDLAERASQVRLMSDIYRRADRVLAWLGLGTPAMQKGLHILENIGRAVLIDWSTLRMQAAQDGDPGLSDASLRPDLEFEECECMMSLLQCPWFYRLWIRQEILLSREAMFVLGSSTVPWPIFKKSIVCLYQKSLPTCILHDPGRQRAYGQVLNALLRLVYPFYSSFSFWDLAAQTADCACIDPRDKIYAIYGLLPIHVRQSWLLEPDYLAPVAAVYEKATRAYVHGTGDLKCLCFCDISNRSDETVSLPSWVPRYNDLTKLSRVELLDSASGGSFAKVLARSKSDPYPKSLTARGTMLGRVQAVSVATLDTVGVAFEAIMGIRKMRGFVSSAYGFADQELRSSSAGHAVLARNFLGGNHQEAFDPPSSANIPQAHGQRAIEALLDPSKSDEDCAQDTGIMAFVESVLHYCSRRVSFVTTDGSWGIGPADLAAGDRICVFLGCSNCIAVRPVENFSSYQVVGPCYIDTWAGGKALLGMLPEPYERSVCVVDESGTQLPGFRKAGTLELEYEDPRFAHILGEDYWERLGLDRLHPNEQMGKIVEEAATARGIEFGWIDLV